jgi:hypothetical protein
LMLLSATAATETGTKTRMRKAQASKPRMDEGRVTKAEPSEAWTERDAAEPAIPASARSDRNSDRPSPAPFRIRVIPRVILWKVTRIALCLNGGNR